MEGGGGKGGKPAATDVRTSYAVLYYGCRKGEEEERAMMMNKQMLFPCSSRRREGGKGWRRERIHPELNKSRGEIVVPDITVAFSLENVLANRCF